MRPPPCFDDREARKHIEQLCTKADIDVKLLEELCDVLQRFSGSGRKDGIVSEFNGIVDAFIARHGEIKGGR